MESNIKEPDIMTSAKEIAEALYNKYQEEMPDRECGRLLLDWVKEVFYGKLIRDVIPTFSYVWERLRKKKHTSKDKALVYGDMDVSTWAELVNGKRILFYIRHCSCADDNTWIFIEFNPFPDMPLFYEFKTVTAWPRQKNNRYGWNTKFQGMAEFPSIATYREFNFNWGYGDGRDEGHVFKYKITCGEPRAENASWNESRILYALSTLDEIKDNLESEGENVMGSPRSN